MLARLQQFVVLVLLAITIAWVWYFGPRGLTWALILPVATMGGYLSTIGLEFVLLHRSYSGRKLARPRLAALLAAWWREVLTAPRVFLWRQPFRSQATADHLSNAQPARRGIVLVHGFLCNRGIWNPWLDQLRARGVSFIALSLEPVFGSIDGYVAQIEDATRRLETHAGLLPIVVGHSMGGLAMRAWLAQCGGVRRIHRAVTIGTPHHGTAMARHAHTANSRQMQVGSTWLAALAANESPDTYSAITCFWSRCDNIVFPTDSATLCGADNRHLDATPHVDMVYHPDILAEVLRLVDSH